jgi:HlyD family secretion protein/adhesin transport system membrane fusion protein
MTDAAAFLNVDADAPAPGARQTSSTGPALPLDSESDHSQRFFVRAMWTVGGLVTALAAIAAVAPINRVAVAEGQILPEGSVMAVSNLEGGVVAEIIAKPGQTVEAGDPLVRLRAGAAASDFGQLAAQQAGLALSQRRLRALLDGKAPNFSDLDASAERVAEEMDSFEAERLALETATRIVDARTTQLSSEIEVLRRELAGARSQHELTIEQQRMRQDLFDRGFATREQVLELDLAVSEARTRIASLESQISVASQAVAQSRSERAGAVAERRRSWSGELARVTTQLEAANSALGKLTERLADLDLRAPGPGVVQSVTPKAAGAIVRPGEPVVEIVSNSSELQAEVRVAPREIGELKPGAAAKLTITAFDSEVYGDVTGVVRRISPMTYSQDGGGSFYIATVGLSRTELQRKGETHALRPGMVVRAEIVVGERTLLQHLFRPIDRALERAFSQG